MLGSFCEHMVVPKPSFPEDTVKVKEVWNCRKLGFQKLHQDRLGLGEDLQVKNVLLLLLDVNCQTMQFLVKSNAQGLWKSH